MLRRHPRKYIRRDQRFNPMEGPSSAEARANTRRIIHAQALNFAIARGEPLPTPPSASVSLAGSSNTSGNIDSSMSSALSRPSVSSERSESSDSEESSSSYSDELSDITSTTDYDSDNPAASARPMLDSTILNFLRQDNPELDDDTLISLALQRHEHFISPMSEAWAQTTVVIPDQDVAGPSQPRPQLQPRPKLQPLAIKAGTISNEKMASRIAVQTCCPVCDNEWLEEGANPGPGDDRVPRFLISTCAHSCCQPCLSGFLESQLRENNYEARCPMTNCEELLTPEEIIEVVGATTAAIFFERKTEATLPDNTIYCPRPECQAVFLNETGEEIDKSNAFECRSCNIASCLNCSLSPYHWNMNCDEARELRLTKGDPKLLHIQQNEQHIAKQLEEGTYFRCPNTKCQVRIEKRGGCLKMSCAKCKHEFCYTCRGRWKGQHDQKYMHFGCLYCPLCKRVTSNVDEHNNDEHAHCNGCNYTFCAVCHKPAHPMRHYQ